MSGHTPDRLANERSRWRRWSEARRRLRAGRYELWRIVRLKLAPLEEHVWSQRYYLMRDRRHFRIAARVAGMDAAARVVGRNR